MSDDITQLYHDLIRRVSEVTVEDALKAAVDSGVSREEAARSLYVLWKEDRVRLEDSRPPASVVHYLFSLYSVWFWMLSIALLLMTLCIYLLPQVPPLNYVRVVLGFITALYLPGSALIEALYPNKTELEPLERGALSVGLSIALTPLVGFVLNYTPWGIRLEPITVSLTGLTLLLGLAAVYRKFVYFRLRVESLDRGLVKKVAV